MKLDEFITKIFNRYVCNTDINEKKEEYIDEFIKYSEKIDFQKLLETVSKNNKRDFIPPVADVLEWSKACYKAEYKKSTSEWLHVKIYNPIYKAVIDNDCFPRGTSEQAILNTYKKRFGGEGWQILEER